ncbi:NAD(P)-binding protein [Phanerochaete sordida]|uniref:NAD(P)-binding protein n=1 Tax=Phanerochaete sordida TaxID=48140 RepID=A0A9P3GYD3_9APHY|nr:NAD(P)-binding protein [Phanerochaete sordida]
MGHAPEIARETQYAAELLPLDLADFASVQACAAALAGAPVDVLVCNAGATQPAYRTTTDGWEHALQVNHLAPALLTLLLLPGLLQAAQAHGCDARAVYVTSELHHHAHLAPAVCAALGVLRALNERGNFPASAARGGWYYETKMFNIMFTRSLTAHLAPSTPLVATSVNPGLCRTRIRRDLPGALRAATGVLGALLGRSAEQGARLVLHAAVGPDGKDGAHVRFLSGQYVSGGAVSEPSDFVVGREGWEVAERVWRETVDILAEVAPEVRGIAEAYFVEEE